MKFVLKSFWFNDFHTLHREGHLTIEITGRFIQSFDVADASLQIGQHLLQHILIAIALERAYCCAALHHPRK